MESFLWGCKFTECLCSTVWRRSWTCRQLGREMWGLGGRWRAGGITKCPWARRFSCQTDRLVRRVCVFSGRKVSTSGSNHEVIGIYQQLYRLPPDILWPFFFFLLLQSDCKKFSLTAPVRQDWWRKLKSRGIQQRRLTVWGSPPCSLT